MQPNYSYQRTTTTSYSQSKSSNNFAPSTSNVSAGTGEAMLDPIGAKNIAKRIMDHYDRDNNGYIDNIETAPMIVDAYKGFNRVFSPDSQDIKSYMKILDRNGDGKITLQDIETLCAKYLTQF